MRRNRAPHPPILANERELALFIPVAQAIAHQPAPEPGGKFGSEVPHPIGVAEDDIARCLLLNDRAQRERITVRRVLFQQRRINRQDLLNLHPRKLRRQGCKIVSQQHRGNGGSKFLRQLLPGRQRFPTGTGQLATLMFSENQNVIRHSNPCSMSEVSSPK